MAVELADDSTGGQFGLTGAVAPLKVLRTLIAFGTKELEKFGFSIFTFQF